MKYKFIYKQYKDSRSELVTKGLKDDTLREIYSIAYEMIFKFKELNSHLNTGILDKIVDNIFLSDILLYGDSFKEFKQIVKIMRNVTVYDLKVIRKLRLYLEKQCIDIEINGENLNSNAVASIITLIMFTCEGFIMYKPLKIRSTFITIGNDLDSLYDIDSLKNKHPLVSYKRESLGESVQDYLSTLSDKGIVVVVNKAVGRSLKSNNLSSLFTHQYIFLTDFYFSMQNENVHDIMSSYIDEDTLKFSVSVSIDASKEYPTLLQRMGLMKNIGEIFKKRKVLIPASGVYLKYSDGYSVVYEYEDEVLGRAISWYTHGYNDIYNGSKTVYMGDELDTVYAIGGGDKAILDILGVSEYFDAYEEFQGLAIEVNESGAFSRVEKMSSLYDFDFEVYAPNSWKDNGLKKMSTGSRLPDKHDKAYGEELKTLSPFKRTLPMGQSRSESANELAKQLCVTLEPNETIVKQFDRKQRVRLK